MSESPLAKARRLAQAGETSAAGQCLAEVVERLFSLAVARVTLRHDVYSLNSLNGFIVAQDGREYFFKFHQEEGEEEIAAGEYYNAGILQEAGLPVEAPLFASRESGWQILLYRRVDDPRLSDLCSAVENTCSEEEKTRLIAVQESLDAKIGAVLCQSLHKITEQKGAVEPIHRLFYWRLVDRESDKVGTSLGGRVASFYQGQAFALPDGTELPWESFSNLRWSINGRSHEISIGELFARGLELLSPQALVGYGGVVAHGDAHNANVFAGGADSGAALALRYFDPAFAGRNVPSLLAEVKATFHNIFAHRFWLYEPDLAESAYAVSARLEGNRLIVEHDWQVSPLRKAFLESKVTRVWQLLLREMQHQGFLRTPEEKERALQTIGVALFCCPTLVLPLRAGAVSGLGATQNATSAILGWALAVSAAEPSKEEQQGKVGDDPFAQFRANLRAS